jgi:hypothetical protein
MPKVVLVLLGILLIIAFLVFVISSIANILFDQKVKREVSELFSDVESTGGIIQKADLEGLPLPVQKWLEYSQVIGKERIKTVRSKQKAVMKMKKEQRWMPTEVENYYSIDKPGFIWKARIKAAPLLYIVGRDKYYEGKGNMLIKVLSFLTVADARGKEIDQGTLIRYLAETVWFPTAALNDYITWKEIDANSAEATMSYGGVTASGVFMFNERGEVTNFVAERHMESGGQFALETWSVPMKDYQEFDGIKIPTKGEVIWKLKTGDFSWYHFEVVAIEYNKPVVY